MTKRTEDAIVDPDAGIQEQPAKGGAAVMATILLVLIYIAFISLGLLMRYLDRHGRYCIRSWEFPYPGRGF